MKKIPLKPYPGFVAVTRSPAEHAREFRKMFGHEYKGKLRCGLTTHRPREFEFLVYASNTPSLAHELSHVLLDLFEYIRSDPASGGGEPFCYMLSHLMEEATKK